MSSYDVTSNTTIASTQSSRKSSLRSSTLDYNGSTNSFLRPEDAIYPSTSPPKQRQRSGSPLGRSDTITTATTLSTTHKRHGRGGRSASRRRKPKRQNNKGTWKKLLWVKQSYPDNYTDEETFLDHLQRNPRLRPYEFWPLVADSTIIVQHVCSVVIFVCCFTGIFQKRVGPQTVVGWATVGTIGGWVVRDLWWKGKEDGIGERACGSADGLANREDEERLSMESTSGSASAPVTADLGLPFREPSLPMSTLSTGAASRVHSRNPSATSAGASGMPVSAVPNSDTSFLPHTVVPANASHIHPYNGTTSPFSPRMQERLTTIKSAILIYCSLLGLSPILKSLTKSTSSDSIWALSSWLMILNVFTFDYGAGPESKFPASLSTNAAVMASTVLASRLPTTTHVFSLTLFSIEVFGLFPVFRRHLRHHSWTGHLWLTTFLVILASGGLSMIISGGGWGYGLLGVVLGGIITCLIMGMTSWWLIGLQRYKNEIHGPWDPARPVIRRHWE